MTRHAEKPMTQRELCQLENARRRDVMRFIHQALTLPAESVHMTDRNGDLLPTFVMRLDCLCAITMLPGEQRIAIEGRLCWPRLSWSTIGRMIDGDPRQAWAAGVDELRRRLLDDDFSYWPEPRIAPWALEVPAWYWQLMGQIKSA